MPWLSLYGLLFLKRLLAVLLLAGPVLSTTAADNAYITFSSGEQKANLLELYTSEGCSSCPPADIWLSKLVSHPGLWREIVLIAFHVTYWNYLGWEDALSDPAHGQRQRAYKRSGAADAVYTPGFMLNGREWRGWFNGENMPESHEMGGVLLGTLKDQQLCVNYKSTTTPGTVHALEVAVLGFDITNHIDSGENRGRELTHQFAVLAHTRKKSDNNHWCQRLQTTGLPAQKLGIAVWVAEADSSTPLQATGSWLAP